ncbi:Cell division cycle protein [Fulvia fulva]|uniref:Cell division cycle protein n=1 Tax=Passalora fulva TaxID=5499 RepID=A0A9Q8P5K7_PASFU|nr:Cell division cycle protein [Fulvia fulva]KAK4632822.1 Cell division cycle protein [Fulvia fulva]UJO14098.1 Cell division cycle protein [Fulvia fulva]
MPSATIDDISASSIMAEPIDDDASSSSTPSTLPFPPVTKSQIMHCSYHYWHPKYRAITPKARLIPLTQPFIDYLRADGIILPDDEEPVDHWDSDSGVFSSSDNPEARDDSDDEEEVDVAADWRDVHQSIKSTIDELGGKVMPKLNWSAPKDATWMNANTMECRTPSDIYLLLKSSDFVTHDLEHAFDDCVDTPDSTISQRDIPYHLVLRKAVPTFNPSVEFRCFVRERKLLCICQRDLNHFDFLLNMQDKLRSMIKEFFEVRLRDSFPDESFAFDVYIPQPYDRVWLVDFNPWAPRTDPILFSWLELLSMDAPQEPGPIPEGQFARLYFNAPKPEGLDTAALEAPANEIDGSSEEEEEDEEDADEELYLPELRLVRKTDPEAYSFATPQYSAHKLPKDVVEAGASGEGLREFARDWQNILEKRRGEDAAAESSDDD